VGGGAAYTEADIPADRPPTPDPSPPLASLAGGGERIAPGTTRFASIHHDLHQIPHLDLGVGVEAVEDAEAVRGAVDAGHAV
jgi:hypothetical protein